YQTPSTPSRLLLRRAAVVVCLALALLPGLLSGYAYVVDAFSYRNYAFLAAENKAPKLYDRSIGGTSYGLQDHPGYDAFLQVLQKTTGVAIRDLPFLPIGDIAIPIL